MITWTTLALWLTVFGATERVRREFRIERSSRYHLGATLALLVFMVPAVWMTVCVAIPSWRGLQIHWGVDV